MIVSIDYLTYIITVPKNQLTLISGDIYELDVEAFRLALMALGDDESGITFPDTFRHATAVTLSGVTYARQIEILPPYTITFEDTGSPYTVVCTGANHNISDRKNVNQVSLIIGNSAGLISVTSGSGVTEQDKIDIINGVWDSLIANHQIVGSAGKALSTASSGGVDYDSLSTAVWEAILTQYETENSAGKKLRELTSGGGSTPLQKPTISVGKISVPL